MVIKINDIPSEGLTRSLEQKINLFDEGGAMTLCAALFTITPAGHGIFHVEGTVSAAPELECSRCLKRFSFPIREAAMSFNLVPERELETAAEHELNRAELDSEFYRGDEIDPMDFMREQLLLAIPMVPVHSPDCKGLCPVCGGDRNLNECGCTDALKRESSPFAALKNIIKPEKE